MAGRDDTHEFRCPACGQEIDVNASMREALLENGCAVCGSPLSVDAFS